MTGGTIYTYKTKIPEYQFLVIVALSIFEGPGDRASLALNLPERIQKVLSVGVQLFS